MNNILTVSNHTIMFTAKRMETDQVEIFTRLSGRRNVFKKTFNPVGHLVERKPRKRQLSAQGN